MKRTTSLTSPCILLAAFAVLAIIFGLFTKEEALVEEDNINHLSSGVLSRPMPASGTPEITHTKGSVEKYILSNEGAVGDRVAICHIPHACVTLSSRKIKMVSILSDSQKDLPFLKDFVAECISPRTFEIMTPKSQLAPEILDADFLIGTFPGEYDQTIPHYPMRTGPLLDISDVVLGSRDPLDGHQFVYDEYILENSKQSHTQDRRSKEPSQEHRRSSFKPAILSPVSHNPYADNGGAKSIWVENFLDTLFVGKQHNFSLIYPPVASVGDTTTCFNSIWTHPQSSSGGRLIEYTNHNMFKGNDLIKSPRLDLCNGDMISITLLDRMESRMLKNIGEIEAAVRLALDDRFSNVEVNHVFFEDASFEEQVSVMQKSDIVVAAHGAAMGNSIFMREKSFLLEVSPFCYHYDRFQADMGTIFDVDGDFVVCQADKEGFEETLTRFCTDQCDELNCTEHRCSCPGKCNTLSTAFDNLSQNADMEFVQRSISNFGTYPDCRLLMRYTASNRGLKAQSLTPDPNLIIEKTSGWLASRCPRLARK